jgi:hypothetical protein
MRKRYTIAYVDGEWIPERCEPGITPYWDNYWIAYGAAKLFGNGNYKGFHEMLSFAKGSKTPDRRPA